jgi:hypothetical protein
VSEDEVRQLVRLHIKQHTVTNKGRPRKGSTGFTRWCRLNGVAKSHASEFMNGTKGPATDLLNALGLEVSYTLRMTPPPHLTDLENEDGSAL